MVVVTVLNVASTGIEWHTLYHRMVEQIPFGQFDAIDEYQDGDSIAVILLPTIVQTVVQVSMPTQMETMNANAKV